MTPKSTRRPEPVGTFDQDWQALTQEGQAPELGGRSAVEAERDKQRKRKLTPSERRRRQRKLTLTLSAELLDKLRAICKSRGYVDEEGHGIVASRVVEQMLWIIVQGYETGLIEEYEQQVITTVQDFRWKNGGGEE